MPRVMIAGLLDVLGWYLKGMGTCCVAYMAIFGKWEL